MHPRNAATPLQAARGLHLPAEWTQTDQEIIEALLFDEPMDRARPDDSELQQALRYRSLLTRQVASDRRKSKHREVQRRFMQRKKQQIQHVKELARRLQQECDFLELSAERKQLQQERETLQEQTSKRQPLPFPSQEHIESMLEEQQQLIRDHYRPLTVQDWDELLRKNLQELEVSSCETDFESTGAVVMGWSDRRKIDYEQGTTRFVMSKRFPHLNAQDFYETTYAKLREPETHPQLFHPAVTVRMQRLQEMNENGVVLHRCMFNPQTGGVVHTIETMMRLQYGRSSLVFLRTLEHNRAYDCLPKTHHWMQLFTALVFTPSLSSSSSSSRRITTDGREPGCIFRYAGCLRDLAPADVTFWLMEMLYVILRFESVMVAPVFALRSE